MSRARELADTIPNGAILQAGDIAYFAMNTPPTGWLKANGAAISRTTFSALFDAIGTTFGAGDGSTTFNLPDMRGEFPRGWDDGRGVDSGRSFGTAQLDQMQRITGELTFSGAGGGPASNASITDGAFSDTPKTTTNVVLQTTSGSGAGSVGFDSSNSPNARASSTTAGETRPRNIALLACIKF